METTTTTTPILNNEMSLNDIIDGWKINLDKLPNYDEFKKPFVIKWNKPLSEEITCGGYDVLTTEVITNYKKNIHERINSLDEIVIYHNNRYGIGRFYSNCDSSPVAHSKYIKHTIFKSLNFVDIDMVKGHPSILRYICKLNNIPTKVFDEVVFNFDKICDNVIEYYKNLCDVVLNKDNVKFYFNLTIYGGSYDTWLNELQDKKKAEKYGYAIKDIPDGIPMPPIFVAFKKACVGIMNFVYINNPNIVNLVCGELFDEDEKKRRVMSYFCGIIENHIVYFVYNKLVEMGGIKPQKCLLELDGLCIPKINNIDYYEITENINKLLEPCEIRFKIKEYGEYVLYETDDDVIENNEIEIENTKQNKIVIDNKIMDENKNDVVAEHQEALNDIATIIEGLENRRKITTIAKKQKKLNDEDVDDEDKTLTDLDLQLIQLKQQLKLKKSQEKKEQLLKKEQEKLEKEHKKEQEKKRADCIKEQNRREKEQNKRENQERIERNKEIKHIEKLNAENEKQRIKNEKQQQNKELYRFAEDDKTASTIIFEELKDILIPDTNGRLFLKINNIWTCDKEKIQNYLLVYITNSNISRENPEKKYIPFAKNVKSAKNIRELVVSLIKEQSDIPDIYDKFHTTTKNRVCFKDGVLDFKAKLFYTWNEINFEYYSTIMINYEFGEYFKNPDKAIITEIKNRIFRNLFGGDIDKALHFFSRAIAGRNDDKNACAMTANRDSGKGAIYDLFKSGFGEYVNPFELGNILIEREAKIEEISRKMYWLLDYEFTRMAISQETPKEEKNQKSTLKADGRIFKKIQGGNDTQKARRNYDIIDTYFKVDMTLMIFGNNYLNVSEKDVEEHLVRFSSVIKYKTQEEINKMRANGETEIAIKSYLIKDPKITELCCSDAWRKAVVYLLYENFIDKAVIIEKDDEDDEELSLRSSLLNKYEITGNKNDFILCSVIYEMMEDFGSKKIDIELKSLGVERKKNKSRGDYRDCMCFFGMKFRDIDDADDEEEEITDNIVNEIKPFTDETQTIKTVKSITLNGIKIKEPTL